MESSVNDIKKENIASMLLALLIISRLMISWLANFAGINSAGLVVMGIVWIIYIYYKVKYDFSFLVSKQAFFFLSVVIICLIFSNMISDGHVRDLTVEFFQYCLIGFMIGQTPFCIEKTTRYVCYMLLGLIFPIYQMLQYDFTQRWQQSITMDHSYFLLPIIICVFIHFLYFRKNKNLLITISEFFAFALLVALLLTGTRGAILSIITFGLLVYLNSNTGEKMGALKRYSLFIILLLFVLFFAEILSAINSLLETVGINFSFLQRTVQYIKNGDLSNGRTELYMIAIRDFFKSPIWGNGIGSFADSYPSLEYPHNMALQFLYEGGFVLGLPILAFLLKSFRVLFVSIGSNIANKVVQTLLFSVAVIPAMLTNEPWAYPLLWCYFGVSVHFSGVMYESDGESIRRYDEDTV